MALQYLHVYVSKPVPVPIVTMVTSSSTWVHHDYLFNLMLVSINVTVMSRMDKEMLLRSCVSFLIISELKIRA